MASAIRIAGNSASSSDDGRRHHRVDAVEILVVLEPDLDIGGRRLAPAWSSSPPDRSDTAGASPADSRGSSAARNGIAPSTQAPTQAGRPRSMSRPKPGGISMPALDVAALEALFEIGVIGERRLLDEIGRAPQLFEIGAALVALIAVENGEGQVVDVGRDAEAEHQHQKGRAEQGEAEPDRIAQQLQRSRGSCRRTAAAD